MKDQVLKLCRRLKQCTLNDIAQFTELSEDEVKPIIYYLLDNNYINESNGVFSPIIKNENSEENRLYLMTQYHSEEDFEIILRAFCAEIPATKIKYLVKCEDTCTCNFYRQFRAKIYEAHQIELQNNYFKQPQISHYRLFFEKYAYFYCFNNNVYVTEKPLRADFEKEIFKQEKLELKKIYSYLRRLESHNQNERYLYHRLAEGIWRRNKKFEQLYSELKLILNL